MAKNLKPDYIKKMLKMEAPNGYKFDVANYLYNPAYGNEYPAFHKVIAETETTQTIRRVYYIKHYDGTGEYKAETFTRKRTATPGRTLRAGRRKFWRRRTGTT